MSRLGPQHLSHFTPKPTVCLCPQHLSHFTPKPTVCPCPQHLSHFTPKPTVCLCPQHLSHFTPKPTVCPCPQHLSHFTPKLQCAHVLSTCPTWGPSPPCAQRPPGLASARSCSWTPRSAPRSPPARSADSCLRAWSLGLCHCCRSDGCWSDPRRLAGRIPLPGSPTVGHPCLAQHGWKCSKQRGCQCNKEVVNVANKEVVSVTKKL